VKRVAVVSGGGSGIGRATCLRLADQGCSVAVLDLNGEAAEAVAEDIRSKSGQAMGIATDVTDRPAVDEAFAKVRGELGPVTVLVTSAGLVAFEPFLEISFESWERVFGVNIHGTFHCCQAALPDMVAARWGRIVTVSSSSAQRGSPRMAHYASSKGAVIALTKTLAREFAPFGITVNNIPPSAIETPMQLQSQTEGHLPSNEVMAKAIPLGHLGTGDDIAAAAAFLCSDDAGFITGQVLGVNGGSVL
jgi:2-hydroxycyclohexanecarboxyl-CoA dehydrogenase